MNLFRNRIAVSLLGIKPSTKNHFDGRSMIDDRIFEQDSLVKFLEMLGVWINDPSQAINQNMAVQYFLT
jgi:hypothetical protein